METLMMVGVSAMSSERGLPLTLVAKASSPAIGSSVALQRRQSTKTLSKYHGVPSRTVQFSGIVLARISMTFTIGKP